MIKSVKPYSEDIYSKFIKLTTHTYFDNMKLLTWMLIKYDKFNYLFNILIFNFFTCFTEQYLDYTN